MRTVSVRLALEIAAYLANAAAAERKTKDLRDEIARLDAAGSAMTKAGLVSSMAALPAAIAPAAAAAAALPAIALTGAAAMGTFALAVNGVGDAMKAVAEDDAEALSEAMKKLTVEGRAFIAEYQRVRPMLQQLGAGTQSALFKPLLGSLELIVGTYMPTLLEQLPKVATEFGEGGRELAMWATAPATVGKVNKQLSATVAITDDLGHLLTEGLGLMVDMGAAGSDFAVGLVDDMARGTTALRRYLAEAERTGQLDQIFENGEATIEGLMAVVAELGDLLMDTLANPSLVSAGKVLFGMLTMGLEIVHGLVNVFDALPEPMQSSIAVLGVISGAVLLLGSRIIALRSAIMAAQVKLDGLGPSGQRASRGLQNTALWAGRAGAAFVGLQIVGGVADAMGAAAPDVEALAAALKVYASTGEAALEMSRLFDADMARFKSNLNFMQRGLEDAKGAAAIESTFGLSGFDWSVSKRIEEMAGLDQALSQLVGSGNAQAASQAFARMSAEATAQGMSIERLKELFPQYARAVEEAARGGTNLSRAQQETSASAKILAGSWQDAARAANGLSGAMDLLNGKNVDAMTAEINLQQAIDDSTAVIKENGKATASNTDEGRENTRSLIGIAEATTVAMQASYDKIVATHGEAAATAAAKRQYDEGRKALIDNAIATGRSRAEAELLADQLMRMPKDVFPTVHLQGVDSAIAKTQTLLSLTRQLGSKVAAINYQTGSDYISGRRWGGIDYAMAGGGTVPAHIATRPTILFGERETGDEAFIPRNGPPARAVATLQEAAGWYGHRIMPAGGTVGGGGGGTTKQVVVHEHHHTVTLAGDGLLSGIRTEIRFLGGDVQTALGTQRTR